MPKVLKGRITSFLGFSLRGNEASYFIELPDGTEAGIYTLEHQDEQFKHVKIQHFPNDQASGHYTTTCEIGLPLKPEVIYTLTKESN